MSVIDQNLVAEFNFSAIVSEKYRENRAENLAVNTTTRKIEGELAESIRKVLGAPEDHAVSIITEDKCWFDNEDGEDGENERSEYNFRVQCGNLTKEFSGYSYTGCLVAMLVWVEVS